MPTYLNLRLFAAILGWSREASYSWMREHPEMVTCSQGSPARVAVTTVEQILGRPLTPADLAHAMAVLERRRVPATPWRGKRSGDAAA